MFCFYMYTQTTTKPTSNIPIQNPEICWRNYLRDKLATSLCSVPLDVDPHFTKGNKHLFTESGEDTWI